MSTFFHVIDIINVHPKREWRRLPFELGFVIFWVTQRGLRGLFYKKWNVAWLSETASKVLALALQRFRSLSPQCNCCLMLNSPAFSVKLSSCSRGSCGLWGVVLMCWHFVLIVIASHTLVRSMPVGVPYSCLCFSGCSPPGEKPLSAFLVNQAF